MSAILQTLWSWSGLLSAIGLLVFWATGRHRWGWLCGVGWELLWIAYGLNSHQYPFAISGVLFGVLFARNWWIWPGRHVG